MCLQNLIHKKAPRYVIAAGHAGLVTGAPEELWLPSLLTGVGAHGHGRRRGRWCVGAEAPVVDRPRRWAVDRYEFHRPVHARGLDGNRVSAATQRRASECVRPAGRDRLLGYHVVLSRLLVVRPGSGTEVGIGPLPGGAEGLLGCRGC